MLPASRNRTYATDTPVNPGDLNDLQDAIGGRKHGPVTIAFTPRLSKLGSWDDDFGAFIKSLAGGQTGKIPFNFGLGAGDRVLEVRAMVLGDGAADCTHTLNRIVAATMVVHVGGAMGTVTDNNRAAAWAELTIFSGAQILDEGDLVELSETPSAANYQIGTILVTFDHP